MTLTDLLVFRPQRLQVCLASHSLGLWKPPLHIKPPSNLFFRRDIAHAENCLGLPTYLSLQGGEICLSGSGSKNRRAAKKRGLMIYAASRRSQLAGDVGRADILSPR